jgi:hypothetical protein
MGRLGGCRMNRFTFLEGEFGQESILGPFFEDDGEYMEYNNGARSSWLVDEVLIGKFLCCL